ncbi:hypothetical protein D3C86_1991600 [compost metagenome]
MDTNVIATAGHEEGYLFAPGSLFSPSQMPSTWTRFNVASSADPGMLRFLAAQMERLSGQPAPAPATPGA